MDNALVQPMNEQFKKPLPGTDLYYFDTREAIKALKQVPMTNCRSAQKYCVRTWYVVALQKT